MKRGQRAAQDALLGPWRLAGVMADEAGVGAIYHRVVQRMRADGLWLTVTETHRENLSAIVNGQGSGAQIQLFGPSQAALQSLSGALHALAAVYFGLTIKGPQ